ncbi:MAG: hypothetical protein JOZ40_18400 [Methylobacteriaceae bacterium]|nr:hypothetical protein [Methylobacteriaceae bacterium]
MSIARHFQKTEGSGALRCDRRDVARRQLEMSIGLVVVLLIASLAALLTIPIPGESKSDPVAAAAPAVIPAKPAGVTRAQVRVIPIFNRQASDEAAPARPS